MPASPSSSPATSGGVGRSRRATAPTTAIPIGSRPSASEPSVPVPASMPAVIGSAWPPRPIAPIRSSGPREPRAAPSWRRPRSSRMTVATTKRTNSCGDADAVGGRLVGREAPGEEQQHGSERQAEADRVPGCLDRLGRHAASLDGARVARRQAASSVRSPGGPVQPNARLDMRPPARASAQPTGGLREAPQEAVQLSSEPKTTSIWSARSPKRSSSRCSRSTRVRPGASSVNRTSTSLAFSVSGSNAHSASSSSSRRSGSADPTP